MRTPKINRFLLSLLWLSAFPATGQRYPIKEYTIHDGLPQMQVFDVYEDSRGYIWANTNLGLSRFNGDKFENFNLKDSLFSYFIRDITEDSHHNIWVRYPNRGYSRFDGRTFTHILFPSGELSEITEYRGRMVFMRNDSLFSLHHDVPRYTGIRQTVKETHSQLKTEPGSGVLYYHTFESLYYLDETAKSFVKLDSMKQQGGAFRLIQQGGKLFYFNRSSEEVFLLEGKTRRKVFGIKDGRAEVYFNPGTNVFFSDDHTRHWLYNIHSNTLETVLMEKVSDVTTSFPAAAGQRLYFGTEKGLKCIFVNGFRYFPLEEVPYAWGVTEDDRKNIWISSFGHPLQKFDGHRLTTVKGYEKVRERVLLKNGVKPPIIPNDWYFYPLRDVSGKLWFPDFRGVLTVGNGRFDYISSKEGYYFFSLAEDRKRKTIIGVGQGGAMLIRNGRTEVLKDTSGMFYKRLLILSAAVTPSGDYWLGGYGLTRYNPETRRFTYYAAKSGRNPFTNVAILFFDHNGGLWAGSLWEGLLKYNEKSDRFEPVFEKYLKDRPATSIIQLSEKYLMVTNGRELLVLDLEAFYKNGTEKVVKVLNQYNGFIGMDTGQNGLFKDSKGRIWITSGTVLSVLDPAQLSLEPQPLKTFIRGINGQKVPFDYEKSFVPEVQNQVRVKVESVGEDKSAVSEYSYRLPGYAEEWSEWQPDDVLYLNQLPSGSYTLEVRSRHGLDGLHSVTRMQFRVSVPLYRSPAFYKYVLVAGGLLLVFLLFLGVNNYLQGRRLRRQQERSADLDRKMKLLQIQTAQSQLNPHFIFNVLQTMQSQILAGDREDAAENVVKLSHLIRGFLNASVLDEEAPISVPGLEIPLSEEVEMLKTYIEFEKEQKDNFDYEIIARPELSGFRIQPLLIQPFVENAIKHGFQDMRYRGRLTIAFREEEDEVLVCTVEDNGIGMEAAREIQKNSIKKYKSLGTKVVMKRIASLNETGYNISVETSVPAGGGTCIKIRMDYKEI